MEGLLRILTTTMVYINKSRYIYSCAEVIGFARIFFIECVHNHFLFVA